MEPQFRLLQTFVLRGARPHLTFFSRGGGWAFSTPGGLFRSNFNPKYNHFSDDFPVIFWYIHIMLLHRIILTSNLIIGSGMWT